MPYANILDLPPSVRMNLPDAAQEIYRESFNFAYAAYAGDSDRDKRAHMIAWAAVKRLYTRNEDQGGGAGGEQWVRRREAASY